MKKIISIILILCLVFSLSGCSAVSEKSHNAETKEKVVINEPEDNTVNGYRTEKPKTNTDKSSMPDKISKDEISVQSSFTPNSPSNSTGYYGNKNSKFFHSASCGSVSKMKEENKVFAKTREEMISSGYKPCGSCKP